MRPRTNLALAALVLALAAACGDNKGARDGIDPVLSLLERAASLHEEAETLARRGEVDAALTRLDAVAELPFPATAPERDDVRIDARVEKARLLLDAGRANDAETAARTAITSSARASYFVGLAWLRLGDALRAQGRSKDAVLAFERSIAVNRATMEHLTHEHGNVSGAKR